MKSSRAPMEFMGTPTWKLPSGKALAEFALQAGFVAPFLMGDRELLGQTSPVKAGRQANATSRGKAAGLVKGTR